MKESVVIHCWTKSPTKTLKNGTRRKPKNKSKSFIIFFAYNSHFALYESIRPSRPSPPLSLSLLLTNPLFRANKVKCLRFSSWHSFCCKRFLSYRALQNVVHEQIPSFSWKREKNVRQKIGNTKNFVQVSIGWPYLNAEEVIKIWMNCWTIGKH